MGSENFADDLDRASMLQDLMNEEAYQRVKENNKPETHPDFDGESCLECGDSLPSARLALGRIRCIICQQRLEKKIKTLGMA